jgi:hypothetical protein
VTGTGNTAGGAKNAIRANATICVPENDAVVIRVRTIGNRAEPPSARFLFWVYQAAQTGGFLL